MAALRPGDQLSHYRIEELVARSGMASIYRATDMRNGRPVAIKIPHPEMEADPVLFDRFKREIEIGEKLDHPGVMKVLDRGEPGQVYMVMEWVEGRLLRKLHGREPQAARGPRARHHHRHLRRARLHSPQRRGAPRSEAREHHDRRPRTASS